MDSIILVGISISNKKNKYFYKLDNTITISREKLRIIKLVLFN